MSNKSNSSVSWQFRLADDSSNSACPRGVRFIGARRASRGPWLTHDQLPAYVRDYFCLEVRQGVPFVEGFESIADLRKDASDIRVQKSPANELKAIVAIDIPRVSAGTVPVLEGFTSGDGAKWGVSDFYEDKEAALLAALSSGQDFTTGWYGVKKEIQSGCVTRIGHLITCEASVSNDLDTEGKGEVQIQVGRKGAKGLLAAIKVGLERASEQAVDNQDSNAVAVIWSVHDKSGAWIETYLARAGVGHDLDQPPGDNYHSWGWQGEGGKVPTKVRESFERLLAVNDGTSDSIKLGAFTFKPTLA